MPAHANWPPGGTDPGPNPPTRCASCPQKEAEGLCATALREVKLLKALNHPNIMSLEAIHMLPAELSLCLAFPYAETGGWVGG